KYQYQYDATGNQIKENTDRYFDWNFADKLSFFKRQAGSSNPSLWAHYFYDASGQRIKKVVNKPGKIQEVTIYIDGIYEHSYVKVNDTINADRNYNTLHVMGGENRIATLRAGKDTTDATPGLKYYVSDHLGNSSVAVQATGNRINLEEYYPFGETSFGSFQYKRYRYNGKEKDEESGLYEYGQRYYAPWLCRFVSVDPIAEDYSYYSSYNYAGNKPITKVDLEGLQESDAKTDTVKGSKNINYDKRTSQQDQDFINQLNEEASNSPLFNEVVQGISDSKIPITIDVIDLDFMGFQAMFKPLLLDTEISEGIEMGDDDTDSTWVVYPDPVEPTNTKEFSGEITVNMSMAGAGNVHEYGMELARPFYLPGIIEELVHAAQYAFYTGMSDSNLKKDYPAGANIEVEAKIITGMILNQVDKDFNAISISDELKQFGEYLNNGARFDQNVYKEVLNNWMLEQKANDTIYKNAKGDFSSSPSFLISLLKR
ncbi:MAG TPA: RHS repeat-associated core domain-containing protein, partial [Aequorivita sp.]|nr:RHS repeat-associated core domain-containing protein [Aequorivita sp.]